MATGDPWFCVAIREICVLAREPGSGLTARAQRVEGTDVHRERTQDAIRRIAFELLSHDSVFSTVQRALLSTRDARRTVERNIERLLAAANLPSARDFERVIDQLAEVDRQIRGLTRRMAKLTADPETPEARD